MFDLRAWWRERNARRRRVDVRAWAELTQHAALLQGYAAADHDQLEALVERFLRRKEIRAAGGLVLDDTMRLTLAAQACVPILHLGLDWYRDWTSVIVYPDAFLARHQYVDAAGVVHEVTRPLSGESWQRGPVVLSWSEVVEGIAEGARANVVIHEMAHKLDALNGAVNGMPPLHRHMSRRAWTEAFTAAFEELLAALEHGEATALDAYAAQSPAEFFAVASEAFFLEPEMLRKAHPAVYGELRDFYRQGRPVDVSLPSP